MLKTGMTISFDPNAPLAALTRRWLGGLAALSGLVLTDCNRYARDDTGALIASSRAASALPKGRLAWSTPYARRVYYTGTPSRTRNPLASLRWCERAKAERLPAWRALAGRLMGGR